VSRILVTGSEGFIGKKAVERFREDGHDVFTLDILGSGNQHFVVDLIGDDLQRLFEECRPELVIHTAAQTDVSKSFEDPLRDFQINVLGTLNLLLACQKIETFVYLHSGGAVYDSSANLPLTEESNEFPISPYGASKRAAEDLVRIICEKYSISWTSLALSNVYGNVSENPKGVVYQFWRNLKSNKVCEINGPNVTRDFVYVEDVVEAIVLASSAKLNTRLNISSGQEISLIELYDLICKVMGMGGAPILLEERKGDVTRSCLSNARAKSLLNWMPKTSLSQGLSKSLRPESR
jgi:UDP-glucose 4-epimerase